MQSFLSDILYKNRKTSTAVLFVSFFITFCVYPLMSVDDTEIAKQSVLSSIPLKGISRTLLESADYNLNEMKSDTSNYSNNYDIVYSLYKKRFEF